MEKYEAPAITDLGSFADKTLDNITKVDGSGDVIVINGVSVPVPGSEVISVS
jgi:hypothetical protein